MARADLSSAASAVGPMLQRVMAIILRGGLRLPVHLARGRGGVGVGVRVGIRVGVGVGIRVGVRVRVGGWGWG